MSPLCSWYQWNGVFPAYSNALDHGKEAQHLGKVSALQFYPETSWDGNWREFSLDIAQAYEATAQ